MSEELVSIEYLMAMTERHGNTPVMLEVTVVSLMCLAANAQLALRHPENTGQSAQLAREFVLQAKEALGTVHPIFAKVIAQGSDPQYDMPAVPGVSTAAGPWQTIEPPHDRPIVILGTLIHRDDVSTWVEPVCCEAQWCENGLEWVEPESGITIRHYYDDELRIQYWADLPRDREPSGSAPEVRVPAFTETREDGATVQMHPAPGVSSGKGDA